MTKSLFRKCLNLGAKSACLAKSRRDFRPQMEILEDRQLLTAFGVTTQIDNGNNANPTSGSLRKASHRRMRLGSTATVKCQSRGQQVPRVRQPLLVGHAYDGCDRDHPHPQHQPVLAINRSELRSGQQSG